VIVATPSGASAGVFGRRLAFGNAEVQRWQAAGKWPIRIAPAAFVDVARAVDGFNGASTPTQVDAGAGLRISMLGLGVLRVDVAHGLRDGHNALSIAFVHGS
jgi:outer membrane translocation and assembly module TamA